MTDKIMRPIRQTEMDYWNFTIDNEYDNRKNSLKSEMVDEINDIADTNYPKFMKALKVDKLFHDGHFKHGDLQDPSKHEPLFKKLCHSETERAYYASPKGRALKLLELSAKRCKHSLNAGLPLDTAVGVIHREMASQKINLDLPKNVFNPMMLENK